MDYVIPLELAARKPDLSAKACLNYIHFFFPHSVIDADKPH